MIPSFFSTSGMPAQSRSRGSVQKSSRSGFSLIEVVIALGIFAFAAVGMIALFSMGLAANRESTEKLLSANIATSILGKWRAIPKAPITDIGLPYLLESANNRSPSPVPILLTEDGNKATDLTKARLALLYKITAPATGTSGGISQVYLYFYWPPQATQAKSTGHFEITTSIPLP